MRRTATVITIALALLIVACSSLWLIPAFLRVNWHLFDNPHTPMYGGPTYNPARDEMIQALQAGGWPSSDIAMGNVDGSYYDATVSEHVDGATCVVRVSYYPANPPTYRVLEVGGRPLTGWIQVDPNQFNQPGISRNTLDARLRAALKSGAIKC